jgi:hypothetical protein
MRKNKKNLQTKKQNIQTTNGLDLHAHMHKHEHEYDHHVTVSPYPSVNEIEKLHDINPNFSAILMNTIAKRVDADIEIDKSKIELEQREQELRGLELGIVDRRLKRGQNYGLIALLFLGCITVGLVYLEAVVTAGFFATTTIVGSIVAFTGINLSSNKKNNNNDNDDEIEE